MNIQNIPVKKLVNNTGQIPGLPRNPRLIRDRRFDALKKSLIDDPEMLNIRELMVFPWNKLFVVIGGNMRLDAGREIGLTEMPCKVLPSDTSIYKLRAYTIKDNAAFGEDDEDLLAEWPEEDLQAFGMDIGVDTDFDRVSSGRKPATKNDPRDEFDANGDFKYESEKPDTYKRLIVDFETEEDYLAFQDITGLSLSDKTRSTFFPAKEKEYAPEMYDPNESEE